MFSFSGVTFVLFCFVFVFLLSLKSWPFVELFFDTHAPRQSHAASLQLSVSSFVLFCFVSLEMSFFPSILVPLPFHLCMESTPYVFSLRMVFFYVVLRCVSVDGHLL